MAGNWRRHGSEFSGLIFIAAYTLTGASFQRMPNLEDFAKSAKEIDGFDIWQGLRNLWLWLKARCETFPFSRTSLFVAPRDIDIPEAASYLLEMTTLYLEGNLSEDRRSPAAHYGKCRYHLGCYTDTIRAFLEHLYSGAEFDNTNLGRQMQAANELQLFFGGLLRIINSVPALEELSQFVGTLDSEKKKKLRSFLLGKSHLAADLSTENVRRWIAEFRKEEDIPLN
jgi:hypothetical protein